MIPVGFKPADPHIIALVLPVLQQIDDWKRHGRCGVAAAVVLTPVAENWCIDCIHWRGAGNGETYRTGWCQKWAEPVPPTASRSCFEG